VSRGFVAGTKAEAFDKLNSSKDREETEAHKGEHSYHRIRLRTRSGPLKFHVQEAVGGECIGEEDLSHQILHRSSTIIGFGRRCVHELSSHMN
jgi:hypothetical protein